MSLHGKELTMKIKVLGCSGAEFPGRNSPTFLLNDEILFDAGSLTSVLDEKAQMKIKHIFVTHAHLDHIRSIPFLADNIIINNMDHRVAILSIPLVIETIKKHLFNSAVWPDFTVIPHPDDAILNLMKLRAGKSLEINDYIITPFAVHHTVPAVGYLVEDRSDRRFFYTGDTGPTAETWRKMGDKQIHALIIDVSFPNRMGKMAIKTGHMTARLLKKELSQFKHLPEHIYVTHPKPQYFEIIKQELSSPEYKNITVLRDGDLISV